ncbi:MAG TPA: hypothetical protein VGZ25_00150 [Gemmataceae bacterium]|nr:hypothetical protein [Gemmataceae bacterium]
MVVYSFLEVLVFLLMGTTNFDIVSLIDADDYFKAHEIAIEPGALANLMMQDPKDGKTQISQLLAIRWLSEHADAVRANEKIRTDLDGIAQGKQAQDGAGFAKDYALRALAKLDGKPAPAPKAAPEGSLRADAFRWFPPQVHILAGLELRPTAKNVPVDEAALRSLSRMMPKDFKREAYAFVDAVGNLRIDRLAIGMEMDENSDEPQRIYLHITGAGDHKRLAEFLTKSIREAKAEEITEPKSDKITLIQNPQEPPCMALIGDTDFVLAGYSQNKSDKSQELVKQMLELRAGKKENVTSGPLADLLKKIPDKANAAAVGELPEAVREKMVKNKGPLTAYPSRFLISMKRDKAIAFQGQGVFKEADQAKVFAGNLENLRTQGQDALKAPPPGMPLPKEALDILQKALEGVKIDNKGETVSGSIEISEEIVRILLTMFETQLKSLPER